MTKREGFTLIELSIVLVIVGLLIGGILVAQSMISTSKVTAVAAQIQQFDAGVMNFKTKYNYLPGDAPAFGGDGDGLIDTSLNCPGFNNYINVFTCEIANFCNNFNPQEYKNNACVSIVGFQAIGSGSGKNVPLSKLGAANSFFIATGESSDAGILNGNSKNYYSILSGVQAQAPSVNNWYFFTTTTNANSAVKTADALALDKKIDDGIANGGTVLSGSIGNLTQKYRWANTNSSNFSLQHWSKLYTN